MLIANLLLALREGFEATLIVGILFAYLKKAGRQDVYPKLWLGIGLAALIPLSFGALLTWGPKTLTFQAQEIIGGGLSLVAVALVTWMIFWMGKNSRQMKGELEGSMAKTLGRHESGWGVVWIAVLAVGREGMETALFIWATVRSSIENNVAATTTGVVLGLIIAIILGWAVYKGAARINMRMFFAVTGIFLIFVAAGICSYGIGDLQEAGVIPGVMNHAWNISHLLPENTSPLYWVYVVGQAMFQINVQPTVGQVIAWWVYLVPVLVLFILQIRGKVFAPSAPSAPGQPAALANGK